MSETDHLVSNFSLFSPFPHLSQDKNPMQESWKKSLSQQSSPFCRRLWFTKMSPFRTDALGGILGGHGNPKTHILFGNILHSRNKPWHLDGTGITNLPAKDIGFGLVDLLFQGDVGDVTILRSYLKKVLFLRDQDHGYKTSEFSVDWITKKLQLCYSMRKSEDI